MRQRQAYLLTLWVPARLCARLSPPPNGVHFLISLSKTSMPIVVEGLADLSNMLTTLAPRAAKRYLVRVADPAAKVVLNAMAETVPVGVGILEEELDYKTKFTDVGGSTILTVSIGPKRSAFWGMFQEFGTRFQVGQHWMGRAWESCKERCLNVFVTEAIGILQDLENKK